MVLISWRCQNGHSRVLPWARSLRRVSGRLASRRSPFMRKKQKTKYIFQYKHNIHSNERTHATGHKPYSEIEMKATIMNSRTTNTLLQEVKRNDIMLHITSHSESFPEHDFQKTDDGGINYCKLSHWLKE